MLCHYNDIRLFIVLFHNMLNQLAFVLQIECRFQNKNLKFSIESISKSLDERLFFKNYNNFDLLIFLVLVLNGSFLPFQEKFCSIFI